MSTMRGTVDAACSSGNGSVGGGTTLGAGTCQDESLPWGGEGVVGDTNATMGPSTFGETTTAVAVTGVAMAFVGEVSELRGRL